MAGLGGVAPEPHVYRSSTLECMIIIAWPEGVEMNEGSGAKKNTGYPSTFNLADPHFPLTWALSPTGI